MRSFFTQSYNFVTGKPTIEQLNEWRENHIEVEFTEKPGKFNSDKRKTQGCISGIQMTKPGGDIGIKITTPYSSAKKEYIWVSNIYSFSITEPIHMLNFSDPNDCVYIGVDEKTYFKVNKRVLAERLNYFRNQELNTGQIIILDFLTEDELKRLIKAIEYKNVNHLNFNEAMTLLIIADKLSDETLRNAAKNVIFTCGTKEDFQSFKNNNDNHAVIQTFLNNLQTEIILWASQTSSLLAKYISCLNFNEIKNLKYLHFYDKEIESACLEFQGASNKLFTLDNIIISRVIMLLGQCEYNIEKLSIPYINSINLDIFCKSSQVNLNLKSIKVTLNNLYRAQPESDYTDINFSEESGFLSLIKNTKSLVKVSITPNPNEKTAQTIKKYLESNRFYNNARLLLFANKYDKDSNVAGAGFNDCLKHIVKLGLQDDVVESTSISPMTNKK